MAQSLFFPSFPPQIPRSPPPIFPARNILSFLLPYYSPTNPNIRAYLPTYPTNGNYGSG